MKQLRAISLLANRRTQTADVRLAPSTPLYIEPPKLNGRANAPLLLTDSKMTIQRKTELLIIFTIICSAGSIFFTILMALR